jgi:uncharacterized membrane protein
MRMSIRASRDIMVTRNITDIMRTTARRAVTMEGNIGATAKVMDTKFFSYHVVTIAIFQILISTSVLYSLEHVT